MVVAAGRGNLAEENLCYLLPAENSEKLLNIRKITIHQSLLN